MKVPKTPTRMAEDFIESQDYTQEKVLKRSKVVWAALVLVIGLIVAVGTGLVYLVHMANQDSATSKIDENTERSERGINDPSPSVPNNVANTSWVLYPITGEGIPDSLKSLKSDVALPEYSERACGAPTDMLNGLLTAAYTPGSDPGVWVVGQMRSSDKEPQACQDTLYESEDVFYFFTEGQADSRVLYVASVSNADRLVASNFLDVANSTVSLVSDGVLFPAESTGTPKYFESWVSSVGHFDYAAPPTVVDQLITSAALTPGVIYVETDDTSKSEAEATKMLREIWAKRTGKLEPSDVLPTVKFVPRGTLNLSSTDWFKSVEGLGTSHG